ncbi:PCI domain-containing protein [Metschnikowia aff. pulcherrima]|uniref:PCI domain-containing protein n=1 Tax=Metschnikowia aff. pulcherrima TaxID=2163413 RepID=A0A4P6XS94_9ASCO|nr:PCI domain-containing protein [Metschnikowia aff. pulcherrima]
MSFYEYIQDFSQAIAQENGRRLKQLLTINPTKDDGPNRAQFPDPSEVDLYPVMEKFQPVIRCYLTVMRSIYISSDINASFFNLNDLVVALNRAAETQSNYVCAALINCSDELISLYQVRAKMKHSEKGGDESDSLELIAATINRLFKICLTDKTLDFAASKKASIHFFLAALIKIYFKLNKLELAKSMEKALMGTGLALPTIVNSPVEYRRHIVTYLYFSALLSLDESEFEFAETKLLTAMQFLSCYKNQAKVATQAEKILFLLAPLKLYNSRKTLPEAVTDKFANVKMVYTQNLFKAVQTGNLRQFEECLKTFQKVFLKRHIYLLVVHLKNLCYLRLIQRAARLCAELNTASPHIVPLSAIQLAIEFATHHSVNSDGALLVPETLASQNYGAPAEEVECVLANLIHKKWIKGYISHANRCIVLLKTDPFPKV